MRGGRVPVVPPGRHRAFQGFARRGSGRGVTRSARAIQVFQGGIMTADRRRPITTSDFNRLLFALLLLAALAVLARLVTRQESRAETPELEATLAQWSQTADAL